MKNIMVITAVVACTLALTACGGGEEGDGVVASILPDAPSLRADEGIWSSGGLTQLVGNQYGMRAVILSDGSFWGVYGTDIYGEGTPIPRTFSATGILQGTASISGNNVSVSGTYTDFPYPSGLLNGTYSGTVSAQKIST